MFKNKAMIPDFSEFSYGYAVTEELVASHKAFVVGAPIFPSLYEEGKKGGGYDLKIPFSGKAVFLQFKLSEYLKKRSAREYQNGLLKVPYYRMHLRPLRHSDQHNLLLDLEVSGETVLYIAPEFHLTRDLNQFYLGKVVVPNSAAFRPMEIGPLPDDEAHYVAYERSFPDAFLCSYEPKLIKKQSLSDGLIPFIKSAGVPTRVLGGDGLRSIANRMLDVLGRAERRFEFRQKSIDIEGIRRITLDRSPSDAVGYIARSFFDAELVILPADP